jgi:hypothetical protein
MENHPVLDGGLNNSGEDPLYPVGTEEGHVKGLVVNAIL